MITNRLLTVCFLALLLVLDVTPTIAQGTDKEIIAYFPEWGVHLQLYYVKDMVGNGSASRLTVLNYAFAIPTPARNGDVTCQGKAKSHSSFNPELYLYRWNAVDPEQSVFLTPDMFQCVRQVREDTRQSATSVSPTSPRRTSSSMQHVRRLFSLLEFQMRS